MNKTEDGLCNKIMDYFKKNPDAGDTMEGIANWWIEHKHPDSTIEDVAGGLDILLKKGLIKMVRIQSGTTIYKIKN